MQDYRILVINPGSTSTKLGLFLRDKRQHVESISHPKDELAPFEHIVDQEDFRYRTIVQWLESRGTDATSCHAVVGRGGLLQPLRSGTYLVTPVMIRDLRAGVQGEHASNLGGILAARIAESASCPAYIVDPVVVDELDDCARYTGFPEIRRRSIFHALNHKAVARAAAGKLGKPYTACNLIVAHLGGGISVGAHRHGMVAEVNNALNGEGPFAPERAGTVPAADLVELCFSGRFSKQEVLRRLAGHAGIAAYFGTNNMREIETRIDSGDETARLVLQAMANQVAKEIGRCAVALRGEIDAIVLTGGLAFDARFVGWITEAVSFLAQVLVFPGEDEMQALAEGALRVLDGVEEARTYAGTY
jgi:butyrate kinase